MNSFPDVLDFKNICMYRSVVPAMQYFNIWGLNYKWIINFKLFFRSPDSGNRYIFRAVTVVSELNKNVFNEAPNHADLKSWMRLWYRNNEMYGNVKIPDIF